MSERLVMKNKEMLKNDPILFIFILKTLNEDKGHKADTLLKEFKWNFMDFFEFGEKKKNIEIFYLHKFIRYLNILKGKLTD